MGNPLYTLRAFQMALATGRLMPRWLCRKLASAIGGPIAVRNNRALAAQRENLNAVTGLEGIELNALCSRNVRNFSTMLADYFYDSSRAGSDAMNLLGHWSGFEHIAAARAAGKGIILVTGHLGNWELGGVLLTQRGIPMSVITLDEPSTALTQWRDDYRRRRGIRTITVGPGREFSFVEMIQTLRRNECLAMLVDRPYMGTGSPVTLFGRETEFSSAPALLWQHTGAAVIPAFVLQDAQGGYSAVAQAPVEMRKLPDPRLALVENTQSIASSFEAVIRQYPEQWFNYVSIWKSASPKH